jgi:hypothetical protein
MKGSLIRVYLKSGKMFAGIVSEWNDQYVEIIHKDELTRITDINSIEAYTIDTKAKVDLKENATTPIAKTPEQKIKLAQTNARQELENVREFLVSPVPHGEPIQHASQLSILRQIKNNTKK